MLCSYVNDCMFVLFQEMFIQSLAQVSLEQSEDSAMLAYKDLADIVANIDTLQFLTGNCHIFPIL